MKLIRMLLPLLVLGLVSCKDAKSGTRGDGAKQTDDRAQPQISPERPVPELVPTPALEKLAASGDGRAAAILAWKYGIGDGVVVNKKKAFAFAHAAADAEHPLGYFVLGDAFSAGIGTGKDEVRAAELFKKALPGLQKLAEGNDPWAQFCLGFALEEGNGAIKDPQKAVEWYEKAAAHGLAVAQNNLATNIKDEKRAAELFEEAAAQGNAEALVSLGIALEAGRSVPKDEKRAAECYRKAAEQGDSIGQHMLGAMYSAGIGVGIDKRKAVDWYEKAAEQGLAAAQNSLGVMYSSGTGVAQDEQKAFDLYQKAAAQGDVNGQANLGVAYEDGIGVKIDEEKAADWYEKAASRGDSSAQLKLGLMLTSGRGRTKDYEKAIDLFRQAAAQGSSEAEYTLGVIYRTGTGVPKDEKVALQWFEKAAAHGSANAQQQLGTNPPPALEAPADLKKMIEYLVVIECNTKMGSGSIIRLKGNSLIVTNAHVLSGNKTVAFRTLNSKALTVGTFGFARDYDLAVVAQTSVEGGLEAMQEVEKNVTIGDDVVVLGNSQGSGVVTEIPGKVTGIGPDLVEVDAKFVAGNSGSPIVHAKTGKVIGIATFATIRKIDALTKDSQFTEVRRFGYRLDTVPEWEFRVWETFEKEAGIIAEVERKSENLIGLLQDIFADGLVNGPLHQGGNNALRRYVAEYLQVMDAPLKPMPMPRPVVVGDVEASFRPDALPGETREQHLARLERLASMGAIGAPPGMSQKEAVRMNVQVHERMVRDAVRQAGAQALADAEAQRQQELRRTAAAYQEAKVNFLRGLAFEATSDTKTLNLDTFTDFHRKKLRKEIEFREMLGKELQKLSTIQDAAREIRLP